MSEPICFGCKYFKQYHPLHFIEPGICGWEPNNTMPDWASLWFDSDDKYYGPHREVRTTGYITTSCPAFKDKDHERPQRPTHTH